MSDSSKTKFSTNILAIAGLITAIGGLITVLMNTGYIAKSKPIPEPTPIPAPNPEPTPVPIPEPIPDPKPVTKVRTYNLTGYWFDANNPNGKYYFNHEPSGKISFTEYSFILGEWITSAQGVGSISGKKLSLPYTTYLGTSGQYEGELSEDGKSISGKIKDHTSGMEIMLFITKQE